MAPEIVRKIEFLAGPADVWALGILLYGLVCGSFPFKGISERDLYRNISRGEFEFNAKISL